MVGKFYNLHVLLDIKYWYSMSKTTCHCVTSCVDRTTTIEVGSPTLNPRACAKKLCFGCVKSISWYLVERYWHDFVDCCEVLSGWVEGNYEIIKVLTSRFEVISYMSLRSKGREHEECTNVVVERDCVWVLGHVGCNINGGG